MVVGDEIGLAANRATGNQMLGSEDLGVDEVVDVNVVVERARESNGRDQAPLRHLIEHFVQHDVVTRAVNSVGANRRRQEAMLTIRGEHPLLTFDLGLSVEATHRRGVGRVFVHLGVDFGIEADIDGARVDETAPALGVTCTDEVLDTADIRIVRRPSIFLRRSAPSEQGEPGRRVEDRIDPFASLHHPVGILDFAPDDFQVRMLELERRISDQRANPIPLFEKASYEVATEESRGAGDETSSEIVQWFVAWHFGLSL